MHTGNPLLLVDVDGVLSLFGFAPGAVPAGRFAMVDGIPHLLSEEAGRNLARLSRTFECVWCTGWEDRAEEYLPSLLGLRGGWPHLTFPHHGQPTTLGHWKLDAIDAYVGPDRAVAWVDDAHDEPCLEWARGRSAPTLLVGTDPAVGLTEEHVHELEAWASRHAGNRGHEADTKGL